MPINILNRQRSISRVGKIRMGERKGEKRPGFQRDTWRFTSANKAAIDMLAQAYGGTVSKYEGEWELDSQSSQLSCIVDTTLSLDESFEKYDGKTRSHYCDGINCEFIEIKRGAQNKIVSCKEHGKVPCICNPDGDGPDPENKTHCYMKTTLEVILPATGDIVRWAFESKGAIFNREVYGVMESLKLMGMKQGYCHLSIKRISKHRGDDVSKFGVAVLTLDPNPPNFVAAILGRTPMAQARELLEATQMAPQLGPNGAKPLEASNRVSDGASGETLTDREIAAAHGLDPEQHGEIQLKTRTKGAAYAAFLREAHSAGEIGFSALLNRTAQLAEAREKPESSGESSPFSDEALGSQEQAPLL